MTGVGKCISECQIFKSKTYVGRKVLATVVMNAVIFWGMAPCSPDVNRRFRETYNLHLQGRKSIEQESRV
jgi:hypothetical protein